MKNKKQRTRKNLADLILKTERGAGNLTYLHLLYCNIVQEINVLPTEGGVRGNLLFLCASVAAHELIYATCGVNQLALTSVEGVRGVTDFQLVEGIGLAFELNSFSSLGGRTAQEHVAIAHVLEYNGTIILGMKSLFHFVFLLVLYAPVPPSEADKGRINIL